MLQMCVHRFLDWFLKLLATLCETWQSTGFQLDWLASLHYLTQLNTLSSAQLSSEHTLSSPALLVTVYAHGCSCVCTQPGCGHLQLLADTAVKRLLPAEHMLWCSAAAELNGAEGSREGPHD